MIRKDKLGTGSSSVGCVAAHDGTKLCFQNLLLALCGYILGLFSVVVILCLLGIIFGLFFCFFLCFFLSLFPVGVLNLFIFLHLTAASVS